MNVNVVADLDHVIFMAHQPGNMSSESQNRIEYWNIYVYVVRIECRASMWKSNNKQSEQHRWQQSVICVDSNRNSIGILCIWFECNMCQHDEIHVFTSATRLLTPTTNILTFIFSQLLRFCNLSKLCFIHQNLLQYMLGYVTFNHILSLGDLLSVKFARWLSALSLNVSII